MDVPDSCFDHLPDSRNTELLRAGHRYAEDIDPVGWSAGRINWGLLKVFKDELDQMVREGTMVLRPVDQRSLAKMEAEGAFGDPHFVVECGVLIAVHYMICSCVSESQLGEFDEAVQAIPLLKALLDRERWRGVRNGGPAEYDDRRLR
ncbi:MAG TPA: hypothetical protein VM282_09595 [Acidimicrobiales bacterium]|nr:hypothetical protein [Acidimicrobiales bacterium]